jgi:primosomal protein N' (replication factor Y)
MPYAKVVVGLPVEGPFDYIVPPQIARKIHTGKRVIVDFRGKKTVGYVVGISAKTAIKKLKPILELIDADPVLNNEMLGLTGDIAGYYCCSWGEAIETALPPALRKGRSFDQPAAKGPGSRDRVPQALLVHDIEGANRWDIYLEAIKKALENKTSAIIIFSDIEAALQAKDFLSPKTGGRISLIYRNQPKELEEWLKIRAGMADIVVGMRSAIFAPLNNLGLIIIDKEEGFAYKQDQVPHYHARQAAFMRSKIEHADLILGTSSPSLESFYLAERKKIAYNFIPAINPPEIKIIDAKYTSEFQKNKGAVLSRYLEDEIGRVLGSGGKILIFLNRKGFATFLSCQHCGKTLKCPRCNVHLVYHFKESLLRCHRCSFKMESPKICPDCNAGYLKYSGIGTEKIESELSRIFPQAKVKNLERLSQDQINSADICVASEAVLKEGNFKFDITGVLSIDNSLNRIDLRSAEKTFALLIGLLKLTKGKLIIQTALPEHHCFKALEDKDINLFYKQELSHRKQLGFPPYKHIALIKIRGGNQPRVEEASSALFAKLKEANKNISIKVLSLSPGQPSKLRGNFYWQILISADSPRRISKFLKISLKNFRHSGIIVTVDIDPI